jgi:hypothetical protein
MRSQHAASVVPRFGIATCWLQELISIEGAMVDHMKLIGDLNHIDRSGCI